MKGSLLLYNLKLTCFIFSTSLNSLLITFIRTYTVNYGNALDRLRVHMNIILVVKQTYSSHICNSIYFDVVTMLSWATRHRCVASTGEVQYVRSL